MVDLIRVINSILSVVGILSWVAWAVRYPKQKWYAVAIVSWLLHVLIFNVSRIIIGAGYPAEFNVWSSAIRLQAIILVIAAAYTVKGKLQHGQYRNDHCSGDCRSTGHPGPDTPET